jgi:hypothetical protein
VRLWCQVADLAPRSYSYAARRRQDTALRVAIEPIAVAFPCYGSRRLRAELRRRNGPVNRKRVLRLEAARQPLGPGPPAGADLDLPAGTGPRAELAEGNPCCISGSGRGRERLLRTLKEEEVS